LCTLILCVRSPVYVFFVLCLEFRIDLILQLLINLPI